MMNSKYVICYSNQLNKLKTDMSINTNIKYHSFQLIQNDDILKSILKLYRIN